jgi:hypothetical protein
LKNPPAPGSVISVKHSGYFSNGRLKKPVFWRERKDLKWENIHELPSSQKVTLSISYFMFKFTQLSKAHEAVWVKKENYRTFFDWLGQELKLEDKEAWYKVPKEVKEEKQESESD